MACLVKVARLFSLQRLAMAECEGQLYLLLRCLAGAFTAQPC